MARVAIITASYPVGVTEQFFEPEAEVWARSGHEVLVLPLSSPGPARPIPPGITVDHSLALLDTPVRRGSPSGLMSALVDRGVRHEAIGLLTAPSTHPLSRARGVAEVVSTEAQVRYVGGRLAALARRTGRLDVVYSYWHGVGAYAAARARRDGAPIGRVVARAHRVDLYEETRPSGHHPRKREYAREIDSHAAISDEGARYLERIYGVPGDRIVVSRLGCAVDGHRTPPTDPPQAELLSASFVTPIKRVSVILDAVQQLARRRPDLRLRWTHLGGGPLLSDLRAEAARVSEPNLVVDLPGQVDHAQVLAHLRSRPIDLFVNHSTSEGVPVSIMEAMAVGIPAVAPAVGGVAELVDGTVGELLGADASPLDLVDALDRQLERSRTAAVRQAAAARVADRYDAERNFVELVRRVTSPAAW